MSSLLKHDVVYVVASLFKMYNFLITQNYFFRDTDSLTYEIETEDVYQDFGMIRINLTIATILKIIPILIKQTKKL